MDYENVSSDDFGAALRGLGINLLVSDVARTCRFLREVLRMETPRESTDFAIAIYDGGLGRQILQLHHDATYHSHPMLGLLPENPPRGAGVDLRLYDRDPDETEARATVLADELGVTVLQTSSEKPHGLREVAILDADGYLWSCSRPKD